LFRSFPALYIIKAFAPLRIPAPLAQPGTPGAAGVALGFQTAAPAAQASRDFI
jgi:hypothetical protein